MERAAQHSTTHYLLSYSSSHRTNMRKYVSQPLTSFTTKRTLGPASSLREYPLSAPWRSLNQTIQLPPTNLATTQTRPKPLFAGKLQPQSKISALFIPTTILAFYLEDFPLMAHYRPSFYSPFLLPSSISPLTKKNRRNQPVSVTLTIPWRNSSTCCKWPMKFAQQ